MMLFPDTYWLAGLKAHFGEHVTSPRFVTRRMQFGDVAAIVPYLLM